MMLLCFPSARARLGRKWLGGVGRRMVRVLDSECVGVSAGISFIGTHAYFITSYCFCSSVCLFDSLFSCTDVLFGLCGTARFVFYFSIFDTLLHITLFIYCSCVIDLCLPFILVVCLLVVILGFLLLLLLP